MPINKETSPSQWQHQDVLQLRVDQWRALLRDPDLFDPNTLRMVAFVYRQPGHTATATAIAAALSTPDAVHHVNQITAWNRKTAKAIYRRFHMGPPVDPQGHKRYWNVLFDGIPDAPKDHNGHYYWVLRPHLAQALADETIHAPVVRKEPVR